MNSFSGCDPAQTLGGEKLSCFFLCLPLAVERHGIVAWSRLRQNLHLSSGFSAVGPAASALCVLHRRIL